MIAGKVRRGAVTGAAGAGLGASALECSSVLSYRSSHRVPSPCAFSVACAFSAPVRRAVLEGALQGQHL